MDELTKHVAAAKLHQEFPGLLIVEGYNNLVTAAKNIRIELKRAFPKTKFSVRTSRFAGGNSIRIDWIDGPTSKQVDAIADKYQSGSFDGMTDCYNYDSTMFNDVFGDAKYVSTQREYSDAFVTIALASVAKVWGVEPISIESWRKGGAWSWRTTCGTSLDRELNIMLSETQG